MDDEDVGSPLMTAPEHMRDSLPQVISSHPRDGNLVPGQHIRLACQACQRKKIKCDRIYPCGQCARSNLQCVPSQRKPRARHVGKRLVDSELRTRISKLENLVETLSGEVAQQQDDDLVQDAPTPDSAADPGSKVFPNVVSPAASSGVASAQSPSLRKYVGSSFWESLTEEVHALREALEDDEDDDHGSAGDVANGSGPGSGNDYDLLIGLGGKVFTMPGALTEPPFQTQMILYDWYASSMAMVYRIHHMPSLFRCLKDGTPYLGYEADSAPIRAVKASIWYAVVNASSEEGCLARIGRPRSEVIREYRRFVDLALCQAQLVLTTDIPTVQAAVTFLLSVRVHDSSRRAWALAALVIRIAQAMNLHVEAPQHSPYQKEIRRRVWWQVRYLDNMTANDRSTLSLLRNEVTDTPRPSNVNDDEFDEHSTAIIEHEGITDASFILLTCESSFFNERLNRPENRPSNDTWQRRLDLAEEFDQAVEVKFRKHCDKSIPYHRFIAAISQAITSSTILRAVRPLDKLKFSTPPRVDSPYVLGIATNCLRTRYNVTKDPEMKRWGWLVWVNWHALAVALAGLCSIRGTDLATQAWFFAEDAYERLRSQIGDSGNGMLWKPIETLHRRAVEFRDGQDSTNNTSSRSSPRGGTTSTQRTASQSHAIPANAASASLAAQTWTMSPTADGDNGGFFPETGFNAPDLAIDPNLSMNYMLATTMPANCPVVPRSSSLCSLPISSGPSPLSAGDLSWLDWERMMQDMPDVEFSGDPLANVQFNGEQYGGFDPVAQQSGFLF